MLTDIGLHTLASRAMLSRLKFMYLILHNKLKRDSNTYIFFSTLLEKPVTSITLHCKNIYAPTILLVLRFSRGQCESGMLYPRRWSWSPLPTNFTNLLAKPSYQLHDSDAIRIVLIIVLPASTFVV